jgi:hypothetical protein
LIEKLAKTLERFDRHIAELTSSRAMGAKAKRCVARSNEIGTGLRHDQINRVNSESLFKAIDGQLDRRLGELSAEQRENRGVHFDGTQTTIECHRTDRAAGRNPVAAESVLGTLTDQIYRKVVMLAEHFAASPRITTN